MNTQHRIATLTLLALASLPLQAQTLAGSTARSTSLEVSAAGDRLGTFAGPAAHLLPQSSQPATAGGALWSHADGGLAWIGGAVSIGNRASQVFVEYDLNNEAAALFSVYDADPPTAIWTDGTPLGTEFRYVASAAATDTHVAIDQVILGGNITTRQAVVRKYSSASATPDWSYTFAPVINAGARVGISRDGQVIVAAIYNDGSGDVEIASFGPGSGTPQSYTSVPVGANFMRGFDLSADGSVLYFSAGVTAYLFDLASQTVVFTANIGASFDSHAISGDGSVFAFGNFNLLRVYEESGGTWVNTHDVTKPGQVYCARIDISDDGSTVAAAWYLYATGLSVIVEALDVPSKTLTMGETVTGSGSFQNAVGAVSCSADGARFAVGLWGDQGGLVDEVRLYARDQNSPLVSLNTPGSVFDLDLSADGQRLVAGSKAVHANTFGNGGRIDLVDAGGEDFIVRGAPRIGSTVVFELHGTPGLNGLLLGSQDEEANPQVFPGIGTLYIDRSTLTITPMGPIPGGGVLGFALSIANDPALVGSSLFYQGAEFTPRRLSQDWLKLTFLP